MSPENGFGSEYPKHNAPCDEKSLVQVNKRLPHPSRLRAKKERRKRATFLEVAPKRFGRRPRGSQRFRGQKRIIGRRQTKIDKRSVIALQVASDSLGKTFGKTSSFHPLKKTLMHGQRLQDEDPGSLTDFQERSTWLFRKKASIFVKLTLKCPVEFLFQLPSQACEGMHCFLGNRKGNLGGRLRPKSGRGMARGILPIAKRQNEQRPQDHKRMDGAP
jgi:hypothetical protein